MDKIKKLNKMALDVIVIKDLKTNTYTAFVKKFPGVVIQASNKDDVTKKIDIAFRNYVKMLQSQHTFNLTDAELA
jgi:predicted RNase H-like HicB family nuclease